MGIDTSVRSVPKIYHIGRNTQGQHSFNICKNTIISTKELVRHYKYKLSKYSNMPCNNRRSTSSKYQSVQLNQKGHQLFRYGWLRKILRESEAAEHIKSHFLSCNYHAIDVYGTREVEAGNQHTRRPTTLQRASRKTISTYM